MLTSIKSSLPKTETVVALLAAWQGIIEQANNIEGASLIPSSDPVGDRMPAWAASIYGPVCDFFSVHPQPFCRYLMDGQPAPDPFKDQLAFRHTLTCWCYQQVPKLDAHGKQVYDLRLISTRWFIEDMTDAASIQMFEMRGTAHLIVALLHRPDRMQRNEGEDLANKSKDAEWKAHVTRVYSALVLPLYVRFETCVPFNVVLPAGGWLPNDVILPLHLLAVDLGVYGGQIGDRVGIARRPGDELKIASQGVPYPEDEEERQRLLARLGFVGGALGSLFSNSDALDSIPNYESAKEGIMGKRLGEPIREIKIRNKHEQ